VRLAPLDIRNESQFYQHLVNLTQSEFFYERVEPSNESGFPDAAFVDRRGEISEGTLELKYFKSGEKPELASAKMRGNQKAALIEYHRAGGNRRFVLAYHGPTKVVFAWSTEDAVRALTRKPHGVRVFALGANGDEVEGPEFAKWLREVLA
jgi:hypothetical protein